MTSLSHLIADALAEASAARAGGCRVCQRIGLPILPLRRAIVGGGPAREDEATGLCTQPTLEGLRTLRQGYLYVLLEASPNRRIWHAYEITPEGCLRQFDPDEPPLEPPAPLSARCIRQDHDVTAWFLNVDTDRYTTARLAFSDDVWPRSVLDAYAGGQAPAERFVQINLQDARQKPATIGLAMTPDQLQVDTEVFEYAQYSDDRLASVHGFHTRAPRLQALRGFVTTARDRFGLDNGVLALVLDDPVGRVQELNAFRLRWVEAKAHWMCEPDRAYRKLTSDCLLQLRQLLAQQAEQQTASFEAHSGDGPPVFGDPEATRQQEVARKTGNALERLQERYHEDQRQAFEETYAQGLAVLQQRIDRTAQVYCTALQAPGFALIERHDYDAGDLASGVAYSQTLSGCLAGGITEARDEQGQLPEQGATVALWKGWLSDPHSVVFKALSLQHAPLLQALLPARGSDGQIEWSDSQKLYDVVTKLIQSDDFGKQLLHPVLKQAQAQTLQAAQSAAQALGQGLRATVHDAVQRATLSALLLHERVHVTQLNVRLHLGAYYMAQTRSLREQQARLQRQASTATRSQMQTLFVGGMMTRQVNTPALQAQMITAKVWLAGQAEVLLAELGDPHRMTPQHSAPTPSLLEVGSGTLQPQARPLLVQLPISAQQAEALVQRSFINPAAQAGAAGTKVGGGGSLLLAVAGAYLQADGLQQTFKRIDDRVGAQHPEAMAALMGSSLGLVGAGIEVVGLAAEKTLKGARFVGAGGTAIDSAITRSLRVSYLGGVIGAAASGFEAAHAGMAAVRTWRAGDVQSTTGYAISGSLYAVATWYGITAVGSSLLIGPLGVAIVAGLAAYGFYRWAQGQESTLLERWARRCVFGKGNETPPVHWTDPRDLDIALGELNAALLGITVSVQFRESAAVQPPGSLEVVILSPRQLRYRLQIPGFDPEQGAYRWSLQVHRHTDLKAPAGDAKDAPRIGRYFSGEELAKGAHSAPGQNASATHQASVALPSIVVRDWNDYEKSTLEPTLEANKEARIVHGAITLKDIKGGDNIKAATMTLTCWPDKEQPEIYAEIILQEVR